MKYSATVCALLSVLAAAGARAEPPPISPVRWNEDYSYLATKSDPDAYEQIKYVPLGGGAYASFGGSLRERVNFYGNDRFGLSPVEDNGSIILQRALIHGDVHLHDHLRAFVELGSYLYDAHRLDPGPYDHNRVDLAQAFLDIDLGEHQLRAGRQYLTLGSSRLVSLRNGPNVRQNFDGMKTDSKLSGAHLSLLALHEVAIEEGGFDDSANADASLWGAYTTWNPGPTQADIYYLGVYKAGAVYTQGMANETRHSFGTRLFGNRGPWDWDYEFVYQTGDYGPDDIRAWTAASITGYTWKDTFWQPRAGVSMNIASGDDDPNDNTLTTFNPLFPRLPYFEEASVLVPQNFFNIQPSVTVHPNDRLTVKMDWDFFWRVETQDAVYSRGLRPLPGTASQEGHFVAHVPTLSVGWKINRFTAVDASYSHLFAGDVIRNAGGEDIDFGMLAVTWSF